jgi:hydroxyacylglutathione hydrolase
MEIMTIPCLHDNYAYLIISDDGQEAAVVDPSEAWPVMREIDRLGTRLKAVLCTHHHHDHIGGIDDLIKAYGEIRVIGFHQDRGRIEQLNEYVADNDSFTVCSLRLGVHHTPGHTSTSILYHLDNHLFVGDTLFGAGCGRLFEGTAEQMTGSLARITSCSEDTKIYFGHEYTALNLRFASTIEPENSDIRQRMAKIAELRSRAEPSTPSLLSEELQTNPFLRVTEKAIIARLTEREGLASTDPVSVFARIRELRNHFS